MLAWLKDEPYKRSAFVANRITEIQNLSSPGSWRYVESKQNPADLATRGILPSELLKLELWWSGPDFLKTTTGIDSPSQPDENVALPPEDDAKQKKSKIVNDSILHTFLSHRRSSIHEVSCNLTVF